MGEQPLSWQKELGKAFGIPEDKHESEKHGQATKPSHDIQKKKEMPKFLQESSDYVSIAEANIQYLHEQMRNNTRRSSSAALTTSKIRNILSMVNQLYNRIVLLRGDLPDDIVHDIQYMKVRLVYEAGREPAVREFCKVCKLIDAIDFIGTDRQRFLRYARYMEALVAYHKFYGGQD